MAFKGSPYPYEPHLPNKPSPKSEFVWDPLGKRKQKDEAGGGQNFHNMEEQIRQSQDTEQELEISCLSASPKNRFNQIDDEVFAELKASIKANGLVYPIIVRPKSCIEHYMIDGDYEILAGHNRVRAVRELGMATIKATVVEVDDVAAVRLINDSNLQRGEVSELEKCWAYRELFDAMNRQGHRSDLEELAEDDELVAIVATSSNGAKKTRDIIAEMYGIAPRTVSNKIRLTNLIKPIFNLYEKRELSQKMAVDLSYLDSDTQENLLKLKKQYPFTFTKENCEELRKDYNLWKREGTELAYADQRILRIMRSGAEPPIVEKREKQVKFSVPENLFPASVKKSEREEYIIKAVQYIKDHGVEL